MQEIWKNIIGFENYQISNFGKIKSLSREINCEGANNHDTRTIKEKFLKYYTNKNGYYSVVLYKNKKPYTKLVHRLVAQAFIPNPNNLPQVNHIDCNKLNNNVTNLEWCTQSENTQHAYDNNLINLNTRKKKRSELINIKKAHESIKRKVNQYDLEGNFIKTWNSIIDASKRLKIDKARIDLCCLKKRNVKTAGGYIWRFKEKKLK